MAKAAGVGPGTLYRHFPTRDDLVAAVLEDHQRDLERVHEEIQSAHLAPVDALERWIAALADWMRTYDGLPSPLRTALDATGNPLGTTCTEVIDTTETFLDPVRRCGLARADIDGRDLFVATLALTWASASNPSADTSRLLAPPAIRMGDALTRRRDRSRATRSTARSAGGCARPRA